jgi:glycosyltransferase involved in cell wall biosynthesis
MRVLVLTHNYPRFPGDFSGTFIRALCVALADLGAAVSVLTPYDPGFVPPVPEQAAPKVQALPYRYIWPKRWHQLGYMRTLDSDIQIRGWALLLAPFLFVFGTLAALRAARRIKPDVIHAHWVLPNGFIGALVSRLTHTPLVVSLPGSDVLMAGKNGAFRWMANFAWRTAALITTNSTDLRDEAVRLGAPAGKFDYIIYGVDARDFMPWSHGTAELRRSLGLAEDDVVVLGVGRMVYKKGFDVLIRAMPLLHEMHPRIKVVLIGEGDQKEAWQKLSKDLGVSDRVFFVGRVPHDRIAVYYNMCDMLAMPSVTHPVDGLNVCVVDAMACGKPLVASRAAGNPLVVADGINGIRVDENRPEQLAHAIARLADAPVLRARMGLASRKRVEEEFDWPHLAERYMEHFKSLVISR